MDNPPTIVSHTFSDLINEIVLKIGSIIIF